MGASLPPTPIPVERRFPLDLNESDHVIRQLYELAKTSKWDPFREFDWALLNQSVTDSALREAARLAYSRRAWQTYTGLTETPAILIRFCLEIGREADPKYFLTVRNTEEAWHIECFHGVAKALGGDLPEPSSGAFAEVFNQRRATTVLDAGTSLDAYFVTHCANEKQLELQLGEISLANSRNDIVKAVWERIVADRRRHAAFGWAYLSRRATQWGQADRTAITESFAAFVGGPLSRGYQCPSLAPADTAEFVAAEQALADAGRGGVPAAAEQVCVRRVIDDARNRLNATGITLPRFTHPIAGEL
ncbi:MAG: hypothetical protein ACKODB_04120 [Betaproteobacteria bacterium]